MPVRILRALALVLLFIGLFNPPAVGHAKEYEVDGIVDCGVPSGRRCDIGDTLALRTDDVTGVLERIQIDVSWVRRHLSRLDQDDRIVLLVEDVPAGGLRALAVVDSEDLEGTDNPGASTGSRRVPEQPKPKQEDDDDNTAILAGTAPIPPVTASSPPAGTVACNAATASGGAGTTITNHSLGRTSGTFQFAYDAFSVPDRFDITYEGNTIFTTGGFVSGSASVNVPFNGSSTTVTVTVIGSSPGTIWNYTVNCPT